MEFALHLYTILDSMYTFIQSAQILNTEHQSYQMIIYSSKTSLPQSLNLLQTTVHSGLHTTLLSFANKNETILFVLSL